MSKKQEFLNFVDELMEAAKVEPEAIPADAKAYLEALRGKEEEDKPLFTDNGKLILKHMQDTPEVPMMKAKDIAEGLFISSRAVSGSVRKLVTDGYVEKVGQDPVIYALTEKGKNTEIN